MGRPPRPISKISNKMGYQAYEAIPLGRFLVSEKFPPGRATDQIEK